MAESLLLVRHGATKCTLSSRYQGTTDEPLAEEGLRQSRAIADVIGARRKPSRCICSPMRRTKQSAEIICGHLNLEPEINPELREMNFGQWEGKNFKEIEAAYPEEVSRWATLDPAFAFPGGDRLSDFFCRAVRAADSLANGCLGEELLVVTHSGVIRTMLCRLLGLDFKHYLAFQIAPASLTVVRIIEGKGVLSEMIRPQS